MKPIYHITHVANLDSIITFGGLCCDQINTKLHPASTGIAHQNIKDRRAKNHVPLGPGGVLADYVPFYFAPRSPMLYAIHRGVVERYKGGQTPVVHLVAYIEDVVAQGVPFVFTDGHADMDITDYFCDLCDLDKVDWQIMSSKYWHDTNQDLDRKRRRQAEFLVYRIFPWKLVAEIGVINTNMADIVAQAIAKATVRPPISIHPEWYY